MDAPSTSGCDLAMDIGTSIFMNAVSKLRSLKEFGVDKDGVSGSKTGNIFRFLLRVLQLGKIDDNFNKGMYVWVNKNDSNSQTCVTKGSLISLL